MEGKPKGFGYVEFASLDDLKEGLSRSGGQLAARTVRVSVAEPPKGGFKGGMFGGVADEKSSWRREGPLPPLAGGAPERRSYGNASPRVGDDEPERDWSAARGSRFTPSGPADGPRFGAGGMGGPGGAAPRSGGFISESGAAAEAASQWRTGKPLSGPPPPGAGFVPRGGPMDRDALPHQRGPRPDMPPGPADTEKEVSALVLSSPRLLLRRLLKPAHAPTSRALLLLLAAD
jgi:RNA recognition motif-containing protein